MFLQSYVVVTTLIESYYFQAYDNVEVFISKTYSYSLKLNIQNQNEVKIMKQPPLLQTEV